MRKAKFPRQMPAPCVGCGLAAHTPARFCGCCGTKIEYVWVSDIGDPGYWDTEELLAG